MKILHVGEYVNGGVATYLKKVIEYQSEQHSVYLMLSEYNSDVNMKDVSKNMIYYMYKRHPSYFFKAMRSIRKSIEQIEPDVIHIHSSFAGLFVRSLYLFKPKKVKIVYCSHGWSFLMDVPFYKKFLFLQIEKLLSRKTDVIINISNFEYEESTKQGIPKHKSVVVYNGVDDPKQASAVALMTSDPGKINVLFVGRFDRQKGIDILLQALKQQPLPDIQVYLIGDKVLHDFDYADLPDNVKIIGWINNEQIDAYYQMSDVVIIPSRWEGFGLVAVEAMRNKKPLIVSNRGALPEIVKQDENGYIFDLNAPQQLIQILSGLNRDELRKMGETGYRMFEEKYRAERMNHEIVSYYR